MSGRAWCDCVAGVASYLLGPSIRLGRQAVGSCVGKPEHSGRCSCEVPPPCWVPVRLGNLSELVCPGDTAVVRLAVTNDGAKARNYEIGTSDPLVMVEPAALTLGPLEHGVAVLSLTVPDTAHGDYVQRCVVSVRGCKEYNFTWTVSVSRSWYHRHRRHGARVRRHHGRDCVRDVVVDDRPDYLHHWYDHFYIERRCLHD
jgi:hypothetical protein